MLFLNRDIIGSCIGGRALIGACGVCDWLCSLHYRSESRQNDMHLAMQSVINAGFDKVRALLDHGLEMVSQLGE
jgi:hypothetical protein